VIPVFMPGYTESTMSNVVEKNKAVYFTYSVLDENGAVLEQYDLPVGYVHGADSGLFEKIEEAMEGREPGDRVEVLLPPEEGFGDIQPDLIFTDDIENVPPEFHYVGAEVTFQNDQGDTKEFRVTAIADGKLTIDGNHPMAGKTATCVVNIIDVRDATPDEIAAGKPADAGPPLH
jgi:FKBP-type peptidyl-prolyl cis-trans isomerase SlyD